jgi:hypothetical protein
VTSTTVFGPTQHALVRRIEGQILFSAKLMFWPLVALTLMALALQVGAWHTEFKIAGPFAAETNPARASLILQVPATRRWALVGDDGAHPFQSLLELRINDREMRPPHSSHEAIRTGQTTAFSHWGSYVIFSLPPGVNNGPETIATLRYILRAPVWITLALIAVSAFLGWLLFIRPLADHRKLILKGPYLALLGLGAFGLIGSAVYAASSLYALATGWALPTRALIRWSPVAEWAARNEPYFGYLLLMLAGVGTVTSWLSYDRPVPEATERGRQFLWWCGFPIATSAFILCMSATWAGVLKPGGSMISSIGALNPFFDAGAYLAAIHDQARDGIWSEVALHRPLAAAFRTTLAFFGNFSLPAMLILQACLVAAATCFAANAIALWRGTWAGLAFFALTYIYARCFVPTTLTEALGLFWALLSIPFFIEAFRSRAAKPALVAYAMTAIALMTRMGSMFTLPLLLVFLIWQFGHGLFAKVRIGVVAICILLGVWGINSLLKNAYGTGTQPTSANFAYVICGLTMGTMWNGCLTKTPSDGKPFSEESGVRASQLYSMALENFRAKPSVLFYRVATVGEEFFRQFPDVIWRGYNFAIPEPNWLFRNALTAICLIGLVFAAQRMTAIELRFWVLLWLSIAGSASIIYMDDGARTLAASHPLIALLLATGFGNRTALAQAERSSRLSQYGTLGLVVTAALFVCIPWIAHRFAAAGVPQKSGEAIVAGGRQMSGYLVVADDQPLRKDVPSIHLASFEVMVAQSNLETVQELIHPVVPPLPFGFVFAPRLEKGASSYSEFIVPAEVLERHTVPRWRFQLMRWGDKPGGLWFYVTKAEPWP